MRARERANPEPHGDREEPYINASFQNCFSSERRLRPSPLRSYKCVFCTSGFQTVLPLTVHPGSTDFISQSDDKLLASTEPMVMAVPLQTLKIFPIMKRAVRCNHAYCNSSGLFTMLKILTKIEA